MATNPDAASYNRMLRVPSDTGSFPYHDCVSKAVGSGVRLWGVSVMGALPSKGFPCNIWRAGRLAVLG